MKPEEHLHVACKHEEFDIVRAEQFEFLPLCFGLVLLGDGNDVTGEVVKVGVTLGIGMVAHDQPDFAMQLPNMPAVSRSTRQWSYFETKRATRGRWLDCANCH